MLWSPKQRRRDMANSKYLNSTAPFPYLPSSSVASAHVQAPTFAPCQDDQVELSIVLPVFNESASLDVMYTQLKTVLKPLDIDYELLFVDDGSSDGSTETILNMARNDHQVTALVLAQHSGKEAALTAGLEQACGRAVIIMDADLQDPPSQLPNMLAAWYAGADVVHMRRQSSTNKPWYKKAASFGMHQLLNIIADVETPKQNTDFMLYSRKAVNALSLLVQRKRYMSAMFNWAGLQTCIIEYQRQPRAAGSSKWRLTSFLGLTPKTATRPADAALRLFMSLTLVIAAISLLHGCITTLSTHLFSHPLPASLTQTSWQAMIWAGVLFCSGWLGKCLRRMQFNSKRPSYTIRALKRSQRHYAGFLY